MRAPLAFYNTDNFTSCAIMHIESAIQIAATDGYALGATLHYADAPAQPELLAIINCATGVKASYYARYARFLADHGYLVITWDYRGIGRSRPASMRQLRACKRDWGEKDFEGVLQWAITNFPHSLIHVIGHSIGGVMPGYSPSNRHIDRLLLVGAQFAYWKDYAPATRTRMLLKWHVLMPLLTAACGYFPGRALGWLEDLPAGVAFEWATRGPRLAPDDPALAARFAALRAPTLAWSISDDEFGTPAAVTRLLNYYAGSDRTLLSLSPAQLHLQHIGHFSFFHDRFSSSLWPQTLQWLTAGSVPQPALRHFQATATAPATPCAQLLAG